MTKSHFEQKLTSDEVLKKIGWLCGYAQGKYLCRCRECGVSFDGDKRAFKCLSCAIGHLLITADRLCKLESVARPIAEKLEKHEDVMVARYSKTGSDNEEFKITAGEARALRLALR